MVLIWSLIAGGIAAASVVSSKHDMRPVVHIGDANAIYAVGATTAQVCVFCHHPHRGPASIGPQLLWNINTSTVTYELYKSSFDNGSMFISTSLVCMSCHDGAGASNSFITRAADGTLGAVPDMSNSPFKIDQIPGSTEEMSANHKVNFVYDDTTVNVTNSTFGLYVQGALSNTIYPLYGGTMQCGTCHDVHSGFDSINNSIGLQFVRGSVIGSLICRDCHPM